MDIDGYTQNLTDQDRAMPVPVVLEGDEPCTVGDMADAIGRAIDAVAAETNSKNNGVYRGGVLSSVISSLIEQFLAFGVDPRKLDDLVAHAKARGVAHAPRRQ